MVGDPGSPVVQIFADNEASLVRMRRTAEMAECRIVSALTIDAEMDLRARALPGATILIELEGEGAGEATMPLLDWLQGEVESGARRGVVSAPAGLIDLVAACASHKEIEHLCSADEAERLAAVVRACRPRAPRLYDVARKSDDRVLQPASGYATAPAGPAEGALVRALIRARRARAEHLPGDLFSDPAWDMLLDLLAARLEGRKVAVSSLCIAAAVPPTTALRWIGVLEERGLILRAADPGDRRRAYVELTSATAYALLAWLGQTRRLTAEVL